MMNDAHDNSVPAEVAPEPAIRNHVEGGVGWIVFDNPRRHNSLSLAMMERILPIMAGYEADPAVRVIVVTGAGGRAFCSGGDLAEFSRNRATAEGTRDYRERFRGAVQSLADAAKPTIAAVEGYCMGGGMALALACDMRFASPDAQFAFPSARLGSGFDYTAIQRLTELTGPARAKEMFLTAARISGQEAERIGLANRCLPKEDFIASVTQIANAIAGNAPLSVMALKRAIDAAERQTDGDALADVRAQLDACARSEDHKEGQRAFKEKRAPVFSGR